MTEEKKKTPISDHIGNLIVGIVIAIVTGLVTAYMSNNLWVKNLELFKTKLTLEEKITTKQIEITERLVSKATILFQDSLLHRSVDLIELMTKFKLSPLVKELIKKHNEFPVVSKEQIFNQFRTFQIELLASKPYIDKDVFESLAKFSAYMNQFIFWAGSSEGIETLYKSAGSELDSAFSKIREKYRLNQIPKSILEIGD